MLESSLFNLAINSLDVDQLTSFNQQLSDYISGLKKVSHKEPVTIDGEYLTSSHNRLQFIDTIKNGGDLQDFKNTVSQDASRVNLQS
jgi:hypothetical protein